MSCELSGLPAAHPAMLIMGFAGLHSVMPMIRLSTADRVECCWRKHFLTH